MPFLPLVLLLAWQAVSKSASFALGWATALYFGQVPGRQGRVLSVISLLALAWLVVLVGFGIPIFGGALLDALGVIGRNFDVQPVHYLALTGAILFTPPFVAGAVVHGNFLDERSVRAWLRLLPVSFPATFMLGLSVLQMVLLTPVLLYQRWRQKRRLLQVPMVMREGTDEDDLVEAVRSCVRAAGIGEATLREATGPRSWPMRTLGFAARHLLGAVVRGEPLRVAADDLEIFAYATNIAILGPAEHAHRVRAAVEREVAFCDAYLTWNDDAQQFEDELMAAAKDSDGDLPTLRRRLEGIQERIDSAKLNSEEWNVLYRLRLQVEHRAEERRAAA